MTGIHTDGTRGWRQHRSAFLLSMFIMDEIIPMYFFPLVCSVISLFHGWTDTV